jgi:hypothetical protein
MNQIPALEPNNLIEHIPAASFAKKVFNRLVNVVANPRRINIECNLTAACIGFMHYFQMQEPNYNVALNYYITTAIYMNLATIHIVNENASFFNLD